MHLGSHQLFISSILAFALHVVDGCGRTPARPKPTSPLLPDEKTTGRPRGPTTNRPNDHKLKCTEEDIAEAECLNGGTCFAVMLLEVRTAHCECVDMWTGVRCERIDGNIFVLPAEEVKMAGIATGVSALVIILAVLIAYVLILRRLKKKRRQELAQNGHVCKPFIQDGNNVEHAHYGHPYTKADAHAIHADFSRYDQCYHDDVDNHGNADHRSHNIGNSETHV